MSPYSRLKFLALAVLSLAAISAVPAASADEQLIASTVSRQLRGDSRISMTQELMLYRYRGRINSVVVIASTRQGRGNLELVADGYTLQSRAVGTQLETIQIPVHRELPYGVNSLELSFRGNFTVAMFGITLEDGMSGPNPPNPPYPSNHLVLGRMENTSFNFSVTDIDSLFQQCADFYRDNRIGNVDEIEVSVNSEAPQRLFNSSSYWKTATEACMQVVHAARTQGVPDSLRYGVMVVAAIESKWEMILRGNNRNDIVQECMRQYQALGMAGSSVDEIDASLNYGQPQRMTNASSYWKDAASVCLQIGSIVP